jgi:NADH:ubiquinone oxidoreductase subunit 6 (subunit J)
MINSITFSILAIILIASAVLIVIKKNIFHASLILMLFLFTMAGMYIHLKAELAATLQVLAYVGGVTTFILFVVMLTNRLTDKSIDRFNKQRLLSLGTIICLFLSFLIPICLSLPLNQHPVNFNEEIMDTGRLMLGNYILSFELISIILTVSIIGAIILVKKEESQ